MPSSRLLVCLFPLTFLMMIDSRRPTTSLSFFANVKFFSYSVCDGFWEYFFWKLNVLFACGGGRGIGRSFRNAFDGGGVLLQISVKLQKIYKSLFRVVELHRLPSCRVIMIFWFISIRYYFISQSCNCMKEKKWQMRRYSLCYESGRWRNCQFFKVANVMQ